ncbi:MAG TPA: DUF2461 domain-containing protein [Vicinamibacterales bacterium]|nr:DUF2461 domain-containing protein [Vicinamibacterales bacterium]
MHPVFTAKTLSFLRSLKRNNDQAWFHARRDQYETHVRTPMMAFVERLADDFRTMAPELAADTKVSLFRPFRDTRFSENKAPLKTNIAAVFPHRALGRMNGAGLYFEVAPGWVWIGGGIYAPDSSQLHAIREHIAGHHRQLDRIVSAPGFQKLGGLEGDRLTRVPRGYPKTHPAARFLVHRQFMGIREEAGAFATRADFYRQLLATFKQFVPLCRFLNEPLLARQQLEGRAHLLEDAYQPNAGSRGVGAARILQFPRAG